MRETIGKIFFFFATGIAALTDIIFRYTTNVSKTHLVDLMLFYMTIGAALLAWPVLTEYMKKREAAKIITITRESIARDLRRN